MKKITRSLATLALATALLTGSTAAFAATPTSVNPALYDDDTAVVEGENTASGLEYGASGVGLSSEIVGAAAGPTVEGQSTSAGLGLGSAALGSVAAPIVFTATR